MGWDLYQWNIILNKELKGQNAIDSTDVENSIKERLNDKEKTKFSFQVQKFEELNLPKCDLIISNNVILL